MNRKIGQQSYMLIKKKGRKGGGAKGHLLCYSSGPRALPESAVDEAVEDDKAEQRKKPVQRHVHVDHVYLG